MTSLRTHCPQSWEHLSFLSLRNSLIHTEHSEMFLSRQYAQRERPLCSLPGDSLFSTSLSTGGPSLLSSSRACFGGSAQRCPIVTSLGFCPFSCEILGSSGIFTMAASSQVKLKGLITLELETLSGVRDCGLCLSWHHHRSWETRTFQSPRYFHFAGGKKTFSQNQLKSQTFLSSFRRK